MRGDELVRRLAVAMLAPALGEHVFLLRLQHREPLDLLQVAGKPRLARDDGKRRGHVDPPVGARSSSRLRRLYGRIRHIVVEQAWPKKGRPRREADEQYEIVVIGAFRLNMDLCYARGPRKALSKFEKSFGGVALEAKRFAGDRMLEAEHRGVQGLPPERGERRPGAVAEQRGLGLEA